MSDLLSKADVRTAVPRALGFSWHPCHCRNSREFGIVIKKLGVSADPCRMVGSILEDRYN